MIKITFTNHPRRDLNEICLIMGHNCETFSISVTFCLLAFSWLELFWHLVSGYRENGGSNQFGAFDEVIDIALLKTNKIVDT